MATPVEIAKQVMKAFCEKDIDTYRNLLHPQYTFQGPCMSYNNREEAVEFLKSECATTGRIENSLYVADGNNVVHLFDWVVEAPFQGKFRMAEYLRIENDQVRSGELFFDSAAFPKTCAEETSKEKCAV